MEGGTVEEMSMYTAQHRMPTTITAKETHDVAMWRQGIEINSYGTKIDATTWQIGFSRKTQRHPDGVVANWFMASPSDPKHFPRTISVARLVLWLGTCRVRVAAASTGCVKHGPIASGRAHITTTPTEDGSTGLPHRLVLKGPMSGLRVAGEESYRTNVGTAGVTKTGSAAQTIIGVKNRPHGTIAGGTTKIRAKNTNVTKIGDSTRLG